MKFSLGGYDRKIDRSRSLVLLEKTNGTSRVASVSHMYLQNKTTVYN